MDLSHDTTRFSDATRRDGWTPALKARFLALLSQSGNARLSARRCGLSAQSAYVQRRRDDAFARGWAAALLHARDHAEQVLADRALEGVEEPVFYRGEQVGTRRRYDNRLLLAHLARLDRLADDEAAARDAGRFDELLALVAGERAPESLAEEEDILPAAREGHADKTAEVAEKAAKRDLPRKRGAAAERERAAAVEAAGDAAWSEAAAQWDAWFDRACAVVDGLAEGEHLPVTGRGTSAGDGGAAPQPLPLRRGEEESLPQDRVNPSTSPSPCATRGLFESAPAVPRAARDPQPTAVRPSGAVDPASPAPLASGRTRGAVGIAEALIGSGR